MTFTTPPVSPEQVGPMPDTYPCCRHCVTDGCTASNGPNTHRVRCYEDLPIGWRRHMAHQIRDADAQASMHARLCAEAFNSMQPNVMKPGQWGQLFDQADTSGLEYARWVKITAALARVAENG